MRAVAVIAAASSALVVSAPTAGRTSDQSRLVALGDSYTAGPLIPHQIPDPPGCGRSDRNYPHLVARELGAALDDVSCSGATTEHMTTPQGVEGGANPPQLDAVETGTDVVTLGIGGNDIGFAQIVLSCMALTPLGTPCRDRHVGPGGDQISRRISEAAPKVAAVLAEISRRAPAATVYLVGYPAILPHDGYGCWPVMPISFSDASYLRDKHVELNSMLAATAAAGGATYLDTYGPSAGHDACSLPPARWVEPVVPASPAAPVHPNARGMRGVAAVVLRAMGAPADVPGPRRKLL